MTASRPSPAGEPLPVAAPPWAGRALETLRDDGSLPRPVRLVPVGGEAGMPDHPEGVQVLWRYHLRPDALLEALDALPDLAWVHSDYVGVDDLPLTELARRGVTLTNGAGISSRPMAEWVVLAVLMGAKQAMRFVRQSDEGRWEVGERAAQLQDAVVTVLGLGAVGTLAARWLGAMGAEVRACVRRPRRDLPAGVARLVVGDAWRAELADSDYVVCALPLTSSTAGMLDTAAFSALKPGAWIVNVARGGIIDDAALLGALEAGTLGGAVLDAFVEEPLPSDHPLWRRPNVLVLPHATWSSPHVIDQFKWRFAEQLHRWCGGRPLADVVDLEAGY